MALLDYDLSRQAPQPQRIDPYDVPLLSLEELDVAQSLMEQYQRAQQLMQFAIMDEEATVSQKAQVLGSITTIIGAISKVQTELYTAERLKRLEQILLQTLKALPKDAQDEFMREYSNELGK